MYTTQIDVSCDFWGEAIDIEVYGRDLGAESSIEYVNFKSCLLMIIQYQPISQQNSWLSNSQPIKIWLSSI